jgi:hypothetical protein
MAPRPVPSIEATTLLGTEPITVLLADPFALLGDTGTDPATVAARPQPDLILLDPARQFLGLPGCPDQRASPARRRIHQSRGRRAQLRAAPLVTTLSMWRANSMQGTSSSSAGCCMNAGCSELTRRGFLNC